MPYLTWCFASVTTVYGGLNNIGRIWVMMDVLTERGIKPETISRLGWRVSGDWLEMPVIQDGKEVGVKSRKFGKDKAFLQSKGCPQIFYNFDDVNIADGKPLIITEGEMDCAVAVQCGYRAVSVPNGAPAEIIEGDTGKKYNYLSAIPKGEQCILAFDSDTAGNNLLHDVSQRIGKARCKWVSYPKGCKDLNETLMKYGERGVHESISRAKWVRVSGVLGVDELPPASFEKTIPCPVDGTGENYKLMLGTLTVITGIPSMGKTTFANELAASMALIHNWNVCIGSFEQSPMEFLVPWLQAYYHKKPRSYQSEDERASSLEWVKEKFKFIIPQDDVDPDLKWLIDGIEAAVIRNEIKLVIIDPWNELEHTHPHEMSETDYTGFAIKQLKKLAARLKIHLVVVNHPSKMPKDKDGKRMVPDLSNCAGSAHWENKPDLGITIHRDEERTTHFIVTKCRYWGRLGMIGTVELKYDEYGHRFVKYGKVI